MSCVRFVILDRLHLVAPHLGRTLRYMHSSTHIQPPGFKHFQFGG
jgi:hypothetical protein